MLVENTTHLFSFKHQFTPVLLVDIVIRLVWTVFVVIFGICMKYPFKIMTSIVEVVKGSPFCWITRTVPLNLMEMTKRGVRAPTVYLEVFAVLPSVNTIS